jgi:hypothetical protein
MHVYLQKAISKKIYKLWYAFFSGRSIKKVGNIGRIQARENSFDLEWGAKKITNPEHRE